MYSLFRATVVALLSNVRLLFYLTLLVGSLVIGWSELSWWPVAFGVGLVFILRGLLGDPAEE